jgi:hypothetical protein
MLKNINIFENFIGIRFPKKIKNGKLRGKDQKDMNNEYKREIGIY